MKFKAEVHTVSDCGDSVAVTLSNVRAVGAADWREYGKEIVINVSFGLARSFNIGRIVTVDVTPKRERP